ncbi:hypothetical protein [Lewinella sp. 4G2]|uniref:hypothetical protein n=1 Tax=Lewinella sp. 4G2 TaxID=1803372 RepID=UPI0007B4DAF1|nr:hypothetical protein [Lewinella sp. 4G2]OAV44758.1 hypothetical protein A3850_009765 [Lewinella sp. 4G2]
MKYLTLLFLSTIIFFACGDPGATTSDPVVASTPTDAITERVAAAEKRLAGSEGGQLVASAIEAHGGLDAWYRQSPLYYHFNYVPTDGKGKVRNSFILNDYRGARAVHQKAGDLDVTYGFDGTDAWQNPADSDPGVSPRFWSLTPYYFVGLPFVLADEGINFEVLENAELDGADLQRVKVTYEAGTGDADDDYYILHLDPTTHELVALNYIVSYRGFFEEGKSLPEKLMRLKGKTRVDGILLPTGYATSWSSDPDVNITDITIADYEFRPDTEDAAFDKPATAKVVNDLPTE